jgi:hypothetical protein
MRAAAISPASEEALTPRELGGFEDESDTATIAS